MIKNLNHLFLGKEERRRTVTPEGEYPLRDITDRNEMVRDLNEWWESVREGTDADPEQVAVWQTQVAEVITNAFQHGPTHHESRNGGPGDHASLVAGKAYLDERTVQLAAMDYGATIPRVIRDVAVAGGCDDNDGDLIRHACKKHVTSRSVPENQGTGLSGLVDTVKRNGGSLQILSKNGLFHVKEGRQYCRNLKRHGSNSPEFDGTLVVLNLRIT